MSLDVGVDCSAVVAVVGIAFVEWAIDCSWSRPPSSICLSSRGADGRTGCSRPTVESGAAVAGRRRGLAAWWAREAAEVRTVWPSFSNFY